MNVRSITSVFIDKLGHLQIALRDVVRDVDGFSRRQRPVLQVLLPSSWFQDSRAILGQVDGIHSVVDGIQSERRGRRQRLDLALRAVLWYKVVLPYQPV